jgi:hypothetical protein
MPEVEHDDDLRDVLQKWAAPLPTDTLDTHILNAYRRAVASPLWKRVLLASVRVPVAVLLAAVAAFTAFVVVRSGPATPAPLYVRLPTPPMPVLVEHAATLDAREPKCLE